MMLQRDPHTKAVINTDAQALNKYKQERALYRKVEVLTKELVVMKETLVRVCEKLEKIENN
jgi:hypothetical protein